MPDDDDIAHMQWLAICGNGMTVEQGRPLWLPPGIYRIGRTYVYASAQTHRAGMLSLRTYAPGTLRAPLPIMDAPRRAILGELALEGIDRRIIEGYHIIGCVCLAPHCDDGAHTAQQGLKAHLPAIQIKYKCHGWVGLKLLLFVMFWWCKYNAFWPIIGRNGVERHLLGQNNRENVCFLKKNYYLCTQKIIILHKRHSDN